MDPNAQVFRTEDSLNQVLTDIATFEERYQRISVQDKGKRFNTDLLEAVELGFLLDLAEVVSWPPCTARRPAAATSARTSPTATTRTTCGTPWPTRMSMPRRTFRGGNCRDPARLQAGGRHPLPADGEEVLR